MFISNIVFHLACTLSEKCISIIQRYSNLKPSYNVAACWSSTSPWKLLYTFLSVSTLLLLEPTWLLCMHGKVITTALAFEGMKYHISLTKDFTEGGIYSLQNMQRICPELGLLILNPKQWAIKHHQFLSFFLFVFSIWRIDNNEKFISVIVRHAMTELEIFLWVG